MGGRKAGRLEGDGILDFGFWMTMTMMMIGIGIGSWEAGMMGD